MVVKFAAFFLKFFSQWGMGSEGNEGTMVGALVRTYFFQ